MIIVCNPGWLGEENGMKFWPHVYLTDITHFYRDVINKKDLIQRTECEYKQGKAYWYFTNNFVQQVFVNNVSDDSKYCILHTKCLPSQRISQKPYTVWAVVTKDESDVAHPTCTSRLSEWNIPEGKNQMWLGEITSFLFVEDTYAKKAVSTYKNRKLKLQSRLNFKTMLGSQAKKLKDKQSVCKDFFSSTHAIIQGVHGGWKSWKSWKS